MMNINSTLDNGNTEALILNIKNNENVQEILDEIQIISPYLSEEAALEVLAQKDMKFTEAEVRIILQQNPDVMNKASVYNQVFNSGGWLEENVDILRSSFGTLTDRTSHILQISNKEEEIINLRRYVVKELLKTEEIDHEEIAYWLSADVRYRNEVKRIQNAFMQGNYIDGMSIASTVDVASYEEGPEPEEWLAFMQLKQIEKDAAHEYDNYINMDQSTKQDLTAKAQNLRGYSGQHSANILNYFFNEDYRQSEMNGSELPSYRTTRREDSEKQGRTMIYPNPAKENVSINLKGKGVVDITLFSGTGQIIKEMYKIEQEIYLLNIGELEGGIYYLNVIPEKGKRIMETDKNEEEILFLISGRFR